MEMFKVSIKRIMLLPVVVLLFFVLSCGGQKGEQQGTKSQSQMQQESATAQQAALKGDPKKGENLYLQNCSACHGPDAKGIKGIGKDLVNSQFAINLSDQELLEYIKKGRGVDDPLNTTGIAMPPKGGNPALTDQQIMDIIAYIRTLEKKNAK